MCYDNFSCQKMTKINNFYYFVSQLQLNVINLNVDRGVKDDRFNRII